MNGYVETAADVAFTLFLAQLLPSDLSDREWLIFQWHRRSAVA